ncbi:MAG: hypothetical protein CNE89_14840 [Sphingomonadaceae bacterium MED-G03]|jgi:uncharacterized protein with HEPN domain|nr:MAG: hypothetical protein CNE89_14840 [Sphingomonadaceae bacterium MED-G03]
MSSKREALRLMDIVENIDSVQDYVADMDLAAFIADRKTIDATERCLQRITEAVIKIGHDRMIDIAPGVPIQAVRGLGNALRHDYDSIDLSAIFVTIKRDLPPLRAACEAALKDAP